MKNLNTIVNKLEAKFEEYELLEGYKEEYDTDDPEFDELTEELTEHEWTDLTFEFEELQEKTLSNFRFIGMYHATTGSAYYTYDASFDSDEYDIVGLYQALNSEYEMEFMDYEENEDTELQVEFQLRRSNHGEAHGGNALSYDPSTGCTMQMYFNELVKLNELVNKFNK